MMLAGVQVLLLVVGLCWLVARWRRARRLARLEREFAAAVARGSYGVAELRATAWFTAAQR